MHIKSETLCCNSRFKKNSIVKFSSANGLNYYFFRAESFETTRQCHQTVWGSEELLEADSWTSNRKKVKDERLRKSSNCSSTLIKIGSNHGKCSIQYVKIGNEPGLYQKRVD